LVGSVQRQLNDDDGTVEVEVVEFVVHVRKCTRVPRFSLQRPQRKLNKLPPVEYLTQLVR
jgi:hypothetical protein